MAKVAVEHIFSGPTSGGYNSSVTFLGALCRQASGADSIDYFAGPYGISFTRPGEAPAAIAAGMVHAISNPGGRTGRAWVWLISQASAATTRPIHMYEHVYASESINFIGTVTPTVSTAGNMTVRGFRMTYDTFTTGTVSGAIDTIYGNGTSWVTDDRIAAGARIGFGSTDPSAISTWYPINQIVSNTQLSLGAPLASSIPASTIYVIEELRAVIACTNATAVSGGLRVVKGLSYDAFNAFQAIPMATTLDNRQATYWLADDVGTSQNTVALGMGLEPKIDNHTHYVYVFNTTTNPRIFKYNIRASLDGCVLGRSASAFVLATSSVVLAGTASQNNNGRYGSHYSYNDALWLTTTTRVYAIPASSLIASGSYTAFPMLEAPPGASTTYAVTNAMNSIELATSIDRMVVLTTGRGYIGRHNNLGEMFEHAFIPETRQYDQSTSSSDAPPIIQSGTSTANNLYIENGWGYFCRNTTTSTNNQLYTWPLAAHWTYQSSAFNEGRIITPALSTPNCQKLYRVYINEGSYGANEFIKKGENYRVYYRTAGISDNSGSWSLLDTTGSLSHDNGAASIQFMFEFKTIGESCLPAKIHSLVVLYETSEYLPSHLQWNFNDSDAASGIIGFSQLQTYGSVPNLLIEYFRSDNDVNVLTQGSTGSTNGIFEYWTGTVWSSGLGTDTIGTRRRFVPTAGLPSGTELYTKINIA